MLYALIDAAGDILRYENLPSPPPALATEKGLRWLPVEDVKPTPGEGEALGDPAVTVEQTRVARVWDRRAKTYAERLADAQTARAKAYPAIGDQLDALFKARAGDPGELAAIDARIAAVKAAHPKPVA